MTEFVAEIVDIREEFRNGIRQRWQMMLDHTAFSVAASEGTLEAVARSGTPLEIPVLGVVVAEGGVWHIVEKPLAVGTAVKGRVLEIPSREG